MEPRTVFLPGYSVSEAGVLEFFGWHEKWFWVRPVLSVLHGCNSRRNVQVKRQRRFSLKWLTKACVGYRKCI